MVAGSDRRPQKAPGQSGAVGNPSLEEVGPATRIIVPKETQIIQLRVKNPFPYMRSLSQIHNHCSMNFCIDPVDNPRFQ
jgi:hypothetical protein